MKMFALLLVVAMVMADDDFGLPIITWEGEDNSTSVASLSQKEKENLNEYVNFFAPDAVKDPNFDEIVGDISGLSESEITTRLEIYMDNEFGFNRLSPATAQQYKVCVSHNGHFIHVPICAIGHFNHEDKHDDMCEKRDKDQCKLLGRGDPVPASFMAMVFDSVFWLFRCGGVQPPLPPGGWNPCGIRLQTLNWVFYDIGYTGLGPLPASNPTGVRRDYTNLKEVDYPAFAWVDGMPIQMKWRPEEGLACAVGANVYAQEASAMTSFELKRELNCMTITFSGMLSAGSASYMTVIPDNDVTVDRVVRSDGSGACCDTVVVGGTYTFPMAAGTHSLAIYANAGTNTCNAAAVEVTVDIRILEGVASCP